MRDDNLIVEFALAGGGLFLFVVACWLFCLLWLAVRFLLDWWWEQRDVET